MIEIDFGLAARLDDHGSGRVGEDSVTVPQFVSLVGWWN